VHYRLEDSTLLCGASEGLSTHDEPWNVTCPACIAVARAETVDDRLKPHPFKYPEHCAACHEIDPYRAWRRDAKPWNGSW
jgi:hypothetical protein